jgi:hypothetical protein
MFFLAKLLRIMQGIGEKYKNIGLEKFRLSIPTTFHKKMLYLDPIYSRKYIEP